MANREISLKWNGYQNNILTNVKDLLKDEGLSDVTLVCGGQSFKAHKVILSANSSVFKSIFQQNPHKDPIIVLHDINTASLKILLSFMYNGEVNVTEEFLPVLLKTADTLRICGLSTGNENSLGDDDKSPSSPMCKKRKRSDPDESYSKIKKSPASGNVDSNVTSDCMDLSKTMNIMPKIEPIDSPMTDFSGDNTTDTDLQEDEKKFTLSPDNSKRNDTDCEKLKKWNSEVSSTQPCLNVDCVDDDKDSVEIDKEVETVLQSGTIVESLSITDNINVASEVQNNKEKTNACYASPSFPCPFCPRVYNSWGYRRRHVKSRHMTNKLSCKWCVSVLSSTSSWYSHATRTHSIPHEDARNSLVVMVEAHAVLTLNEPSVAQLLGQVGITDASGNDCEKNTN